MTDILLNIEGLGHKGEGVARHEGRRIFVPFALPGEIVRVELAGDRARLVSIEKASSDRAAPFCPYFTRCGGCQVQHLSEPAYRAFKIGLIEDPLRRLAIDNGVERLIDARGEGRRRATLHARAEGVGFMRARSHEVEPIAFCPVLAPPLRDAAPRIAAELGAVLGECDVALTQTRAGIDVAVRVERARAKPDRLAALFRRLKLARLALNGESVLQANIPSLDMGRAEVALPVGSFLQATAEAETRLGAFVLEHSAPSKAPLDLFCGLGPFTLRLAERAPVTAFDSDSPAIAALTAAARHTQGLKPVTAHARDLFREPLTRFELEAFDCAVLDPPRAGAEAQIREIAASKLAHVVMIACDAHSFARDARLLVDSGFEMSQLTGFDQFAYSAHVEIGAVFKRARARKRLGATSGVPFPKGWARR